VSATHAANAVLRQNDVETVRSGYAISSSNIDEAPSTAPWIHPLAQQDRARTACRRRIGLPRSKGLTLGHELLPRQGDPIASRPPALGVADFKGKVIARPTPGGAIHISLLHNLVKSRAVPPRFMTFVTL
jgi:hypothetical protein